MSHRCRVCLDDVEGQGDYHPRCLRGLFGSTTLPALDLEVSKLHTAALAMIGRTSLSGIQKKISVNLSADRQTLQVAAEGGRYILKPQTETYPSLPENEHLVTLLARRAGLEVAASGLVALREGSLAFIVRRFDRLADGHKVRQEDFCQLAEKPPKDKYEGSAEFCVRLLRRYASEPLVEILRLFRQLVFAWLTGNGDLHLKNLSVLVDAEGMVRLTPAYDLVCTRLVIPEDPLALPVVGKKDRLDRDDWLEFAKYGGLPPRSAVRALDELAAGLADAAAVIDRSWLPAEQKQLLAGLVAQRLAVLAGT